MSVNIGEIAGQVWRYLDSNGEKPVSLTTLAKNTGFKKEEVAMGVGWLAREDNLNIAESGKILLKK